MIKYQLQCADGHGFEAWFRSSIDYDDQADAGDLCCPICDCQDVRKAIMAPAITRSGSRKTLSADAMGEQILSAARRARAYVEKNFDYVGDRFPEEARRIHYGETSDRPIYGEATRNEARDLVDEGVQIAPLPDPAAPSDRAPSDQPKQGSDRHAVDGEPRLRPSANSSARQSARTPGHPTPAVSPEKPADRSADLTRADRPARRDGGATGQLQPAPIDKKKLN